MAKIELEDIADQCLTDGLQFGVNAHFVLAVAMLRSQLDDGEDQGRFGPFLWSQADWDGLTERTSPDLGAPFPSDFVADWRAQVTVFSLVTRGRFGELARKAGANPSAIDLYQALWPLEQRPDLLKELQKACDKTKDAILTAIDQQLPEDPGLAGTLLDDAKAVIDEPNAPAGSSSGGVGAPPGGRPDDDPTPFAAFGATVVNVVWPVATANANREVAYVSTDGHPHGRPGRCFFAARGTKRHHVGIDLFAKEGDEVVACADGTIVNYHRFYNSKGKDTFALLIEHDGVVINYGEVQKESLALLGLKIGDPVRSGQPIGRVGATGMLHLETYRPGTRQSMRWMNGEPRPFKILDPTLLLLKLNAPGFASGGSSTGHAGSVGTAQAPSPAIASIEPGLRTALRLHEIGDASPYRLFFAGKGNSGASFGFMQGDLAAGQPIVIQSFRKALMAASFLEPQITALLNQLSVPLITNPLSATVTKAVNAALAASSAVVDAMDAQILADVYADVQRCIDAATNAQRTITPKALIYMALWINMSGPPTSLLKWLSGIDPKLAKAVPLPGKEVDGAAMEAYLGGTAYYVENPGNLSHMLQSAAAGEVVLKTP